MWYAYAILCDNGSIYKGHTDNIERRYKEHLNGLGANHTKRYKPKHLIYIKEFSTQSGALIHEKYLKTGSGREMLKVECGLYAD
ncbi:MAG: GIY-YIG nuclease family protein [Firmicutes bacterium]|nr:GIY-YIG nuclease family protein [Bacillota bacterium]